MLNSIVTIVTVKWNWAFDIAAVEFYKRATQLVPDIEFQVDFTMLHNPRGNIPI